MCIRLLLLLLTLVFGVRSALAGGVDVDLVSFYGNDSLTYSEIYVGIQRDALIYSKQGEDSMRAVFSIVSSLSISDTIFLSDTLDTEDIVSDSLTPGQGAYFPYTFRYYIRPGMYGIKVTLLQLDGRSISTVDRKITIPKITEAAGVSEIALGAELSFTEDGSSFSKNGVKFVPNPSGFYGSGLPMLYYYMECYGLSTDSTQTDSLTVTRNVLSGASGLNAKLPSERKMFKPGSSLVVTDGFPAYTLKTGTYILEIVIKEQGMADRKARRKFWVYRPEDNAQGRVVDIDPEMRRAMIANSGDILNTIDPDSAIEIMAYVLSKQDERRVRDMEPDGKRRFLIEFWNSHAPEDAEAANRYFARAAEANERYSFLNQLGWKTDRGRILIQHGEPDFVDRRYAEAQVPDHEIWHYDRIEGGVLFVFFDRSGFGDLDLVHSTLRGEIYNPDWARSTQDKNSSSRGLRE